MSDFLNFSLTSREQVYDWVLRKLGWPLVHVEIHEDQLNDCLNDSVEEFTEWVIQDECYVGLNLDDYESLSGGFDLTQYRAVSVFALEEGSTAGNMAGHNTLFSIQNTMWNQGQFVLPTGGDWVSYELALQYMDMVKRMTAAKFHFDYNPRSKRLSLIPDPTKSGTKGSICVGLKILRSEDQQYGETWVKRMTLAKAKQVCGYVRSKIDGTQLLGGGSINTEIKSEGLQEEEQLREELRSTYTLTEFYVG